MELNPNSFHDLNEEGFFPGPHEDENAFARRVTDTKDWISKLKHEDLVLQREKIVMPLGKRIPETHMQEAAKISKTLYNVSPIWVPAFYQNKGLPSLTGGMAIHFKESEHQPWFSFFQLKSCFRQQPKWLIYHRNEIISHEMCHVARGALESTRYEETFAYQCSTNIFRKWIGGALVRSTDSLMIIIALFWMLACDITPLFFSNVPFPLFWIGKLPIFFLITYGLLRNIKIRREMHLAQQKLTKLFPKREREILFRLSDEEIKALSSLNVEASRLWWENLRSFRGTFLRNIYQNQ